LPDGPRERSRVSSGSPYEEPYGFSRAVRAHDWILVAGTAPIWSDGSCNQDPSAQARRCCEIIVEALGALGAGAADVVRTRVYITDSAIAGSVGAVHGEFFGTAAPAATMVIVAGLLDPRWVVEIEAEALVASPAS